MEQLTLKLDALDHERLLRLYEKCEGSPSQMYEKYPFILARVLNPYLAKAPGEVVGGAEWDTDTGELTVEYEPYEPEPRRCPECGARLDEEDQL